MKFKKCHLNREEQKAANPWIIASSARKKFQKNICMMKDADGDKCNGKIINSHTISKSENLKKISENNHIYTYKVEMNDFIKNNWKNIGKLIGINKASTFNGFCANHDRELFSNIENEDFKSTPDQCLSLAYRSVSIDYYNKIALANIQEDLANADKGKDIFSQANVILLNSLLKNGADLAVSDYKGTYKILEAAILNKSNPLKTLIIEYDEIIPYAYAGAWTVFRDIHNNKIQNENSSDPQNQIISYTHSTDKTYVGFSYINKENNDVKNIIDQLRITSNDKISSIVLQYILKHLENIYFNPSWVEGLNKNQKDKMDNLVMSGVDALGSTPDADIDPNFDFNLPNPSRIFEV